MKTLDQMIAQMQGLRAQSEKHTTVENSIAEQAKSNGVLLQDLRKQLALAGNDPTKLAQLGDLIDGLAAQQMSEDNAQDAVKAALANTDADPNKKTDPVDEPFVEQPSGDDSLKAGSGGDQNPQPQNGAMPGNISQGSQDSGGQQQGQGDDTLRSGGAGQQSPQPPVQPAADIPEGSRQTGPTGEMFEVKAGQWVLLQA